MNIDLEFPQISIYIQDTNNIILHTIRSYFSIPRLDEVDYYSNANTNNGHYGRIKYKVVKYSADLNDNYPDIYITVDTSHNLLDN